MRKIKSKWNTWVVEILGVEGDTEGSHYVANRRRAREVARSITEAGGLARVRRVA